MAKQQSRNKHKYTFGKPYSIRYSMLGYFVLFAVLILIILWLLQTVFLNSYYRNMKRENVEEAAAAVTDIFRDPSERDEQERVDRLREIAMQHGVTAHVLFENGVMISTGEASDLPERALSNKLPTHVRENLQQHVMDNIRDHIYSQPNRTLVRFTAMDMRGAQTLLYGKVITRADGSEIVLLITSNLQPLDETVQVLSKQLVYVTASMFIMAMILSVIFSSTMAKPLGVLTEKAKQLSSGDMSVQFEGGKIAEISQLADTLNYATEELRQVEKLRNELIANVSHDLRTPLTMIKGYAEMLRDFSGNDPVKREKHLAVIVEETDRLTRLVNELLELSKAQAGVVELDKSSFDLGRLVEKVFGRFDMLRTGEGYELKFDCCSDAIVYADEDKIEQVIYNLMGNAVNYTGADKKIFVTIADEGDFVRFAVRDTGEGIDEANLAYIWDRYYRVDKEHKRTVVGTGIGLSIVKTLMKLHEADYGVNSKVGEGSEFWFRLPKGGRE